MKRVVSALFCLSLAAAVMAAGKANFTGTWAMDKSRSEGVPPDMEQTMTVTQNGDTINQETKVITDQGDQSIATTYVLDGKETEYPVKRQIGDGKGKRTAKWTADGNGFEVTEEESVDTQNGPVTLKFMRRWVMAADGSTLIIELDVDSPNGKQHTKRTFVKK
ncbi:MAG TPA: hypothetical protein VGN86_17735 [Pyrinomonadaceae bacterium]|jgi:hypothetical protein|nr:hypothetical protein [Pyrinomonadaceae bacterium]